jgi:hypothetical protein
LDQTFFIQNIKHKKDIHEEIFHLVWLGEGRWDWNTVYNWPIWMRKFYTEQLSKIILQKQSTTNTPPESPKRAKPPF